MKPLNKYIIKKDILNKNKPSFIYFNKKNLLLKKSLIEAAPPKKITITRNIKNDDNTTKEEIKTNANSDNTFIIGYKKDQNDDNISFEEIYDGNNNDYFNNNYISNKDFQKNNYINIRRRKILLEIKKALTPFKNEESNFLDQEEDEDEEYNPYQRRKKLLKTVKVNNIKDNLRNYFSDSELNSRNQRANTDPKDKISNDKNNKNNNNMINFKNSKFLFEEESDIKGNERVYRLSNSNSSKNDNSNNNKDDKNLKKSILKLNKKKRKSDDLISDSKNDSSIENKKFRKKRINNNENDDIINFKTQNFNIVEERNKQNFRNSISENRKLKTSLNDSKLKFQNWSNVGKDINNSIDYIDYSPASTEFDIYLFSPKYKFLNFYVNYFIKRDIFLTSFYNKRENIPAFIRISTFILVIFFIFAMNCLFLTSDYIHKRYVYSLKHNKLNEANYVFTKEFGKSACVALISNIFKMICVKIVYGLFFKISEKTKEELSPSGEINVEDNNNLKQKKEEYFKKYRKKSVIYISIVVVLVLFFGYISINYIGTFPNTKVGILLSFILSVVLSIIFCAFICLIIVLFHFIGKKFNLGGFIICYNWLKIIY